MRGVQIALTIQGSTIFVRTGDDGQYRFRNLMPGSYTVRESQPPWLRFSTTPDDVTVTLAAGETRTVDFGDWNGRATYLPLILR